MDIYATGGYTWQGLSVFAIDGSKYRLPASDALRSAFDPDRGLDHPGKGHYLHCLVSTAYDVFRWLPIARTVKSLAQANEREEVKALLPHLPTGGVLLFDRGYPSDELIDYLKRHYQGYWLIRCPASATFPAVEAFVGSGQPQALITLAGEAAILTPQCPELALVIFNELLREIARVRYYRPETPRQGSHSRVSPKNRSINGTLPAPSPSVTLN